MLVVNCIRLYTGWIYTAYNYSTSLRQPAHSLSLSALRVAAGRRYRCASCSPPLMPFPPATPKSGFPGSRLWTPLTLDSSCRRSESYPWPHPSASMSIIPRYSLQILPFPYPALPKSSSPLLSFCIHHRNHRYDPILLSLLIFFPSICSTELEVELR
jgi:hypothetical protein